MTDTDKKLSELEPKTNPTGTDEVEVLSSSDNYRTPLNTLPVSIASQAAIDAGDATKQPLDDELTAIAGLTSAANKIIRFTGSGTAGLLDFKDEDNMASDSATAVPSQQSTKAYVDTKTSGVYNVKFYGAVGDGTTNDATAIQAALTAANTAGGGEVVFPKGTYSIGATLTFANNTIVRALGTMGDSSSYYSDGAVVIRAATNLNTRMISLDDKIGVTVKGIVFDGNRANQSSPSYIVYGNYDISGSGCSVNFEDCTFINSAGVQAVRMEGKSTGLLVEFSFRHCAFEGCMAGSYIGVNSVWGKFINCTASDGAEATGYGNFGFVNSNCLILGCDFEGLSGVYLHISGGAQVATSNLISNNNFESGAGGIIIEIDNHSGFLINNNIFYTNGGSAVIANICSSFNIQNNNMLGGTSNGYGIRLTGSCARFNLTGNNIYGGFAGGISLTSGKENYIISGNNCDDGLDDSGGGTNKVVADNVTS